MPCVLRAASLFSAVFEHFNSCHVAAYAFAEVAGAVAAYFTLIINANRVGAVVADYVVDAVAQELNSPAVRKFSCFLKQNVRSLISGHKRSSQAYFDARKDKSSSPLSCISAKAYYRKAANI